MFSTVPSTVLRFRVELAVDELYISFWDEQRCLLQNDSQGVVAASIQGGVGSSLGFCGSRIRYQGPAIDVIVSDGLDG